LKRCRFLKRRVNACLKLANAFFSLINIGYFVFFRAVNFAPQAAYL
jgi:hypothetical protein